MSHELGKTVLEAAGRNGASYADVRIGEIFDEHVTVKKGLPDEVSLRQAGGMGVRVIVDGAWGFAGSIFLNKKEAMQTTKTAVSIAKASAKLKKKNVKLTSQKASKDKYTAPMRKDPFKIPLEEKIEVLLAAERIIATQSDLIKSSSAFFRAFRENKLFMSTEGAEVNQQVTWCGGGLEAVAVKNGEVQRRSFPASFRGNFSTSGYEFFESLVLPDHAKQVGSEVVQLLDAEKCPSTDADLILTGDQLALQVHESCGHPTELDRALGMEADYAGTSFLVPDELGRLKYGSESVNIVADATVSGGLGTFGYDDEGTPATCVNLIKDGLFVGYQTSRETAAELGLKQSSGGMRAMSTTALPLIRMTNINLLPGSWKADEIIEDTKNGVLMMVNRSWSIDDRRLNFQFGTEIAWEIKNGSKGKLLKNPTYTGMTPIFWGSCDAVSKNDWKMWGTPNCGKGVPGQVIYVGHGCSTARFRKTRVGVLR
ncbi:MAG TPA: TldD/PmbA family protein [Candidatus Bathyarchaeia archaeon]|nr:TldD/PmbA family protein [Candidatus Bathyarchaeia archaeon]